MGLKCAGRAPAGPYSRTVARDSAVVGRACHRTNRRVESEVLRDVWFVREAIRLAIHSDLLEILVCPACKAKVELKADGTGLVCPECHRVYPIRDDIPVMLIDEAKIEEDGGAA